MFDGLEPQHVVVRELDAARLEKQDRRFDLLDLEAQRRVFGLRATPLGEEGQRGAADAVVELAVRASTQCFQSQAVLIEAARSRHVTSTHWCDITPSSCRFA